MTKTLQLLLAGLFYCLTCGLPSVEGNEPINHQADPLHVVGHQKCLKCHEQEVQVWQKTPHYRTYETLHRTPEAQTIATRLGLSSIKRNDVCIQCHYTQQQQEQRIKPISGVSCESCHGAAKDWLELHSDYGGPLVTRDQETAEHKQRRRATSIASGMRNPSNLYLVAQSCFGCHTTPNEELVNVGGHKPGSLDFELVTWSQGSLRHNFVHSEASSNAQSPPDRLRVMFLVGKMTDLEYSLRATARATQKATFGITSAQRVDRLRRELKQIQTIINNPYLDDALSAAYQAKLQPNNREALEAAADTVGRAAYQFASEVDGSELTPLDVMLPNPTDYK